MEKPDNEDIIIQIEETCIVQLLEVAWYTLWDRTCSILYSKDHDTFYPWPIRDLGLRSGGDIIIQILNK
jgi:hypothetical protein